MSLADRLLRTPATRKARCVVADTIDSLPDDDREAVLSAIRSGQNTEHIARAMAEEGYRIAPTSLARHRSGRCCCGAQ